MADSKNQKTPVKPSTQSVKQPAARNTPAAKPVSQSAKTATASKTTSTVKPVTAQVKRDASQVKQAPVRSAAPNHREKPASAAPVRPTSSQTSARPVASASKPSATKPHNADAETAASKEVKHESKREQPKAVKPDKDKRAAAPGAQKEIHAKNSAGSKSGVAAAKTKLDRKKLIFIAAAVIVAVVIVLTVILVSCNGASDQARPTLKPVDVSIDPYKDGAYSQTERPSDNEFAVGGGLGVGSFENAYKNRTKVGYKAEYLGEVRRNIPTETSDGGLVSNGTVKEYPKYGYTANYSEAQKIAVIGESWTLCSINTRIGSDGFPKGTYNKIDRDGNLLLNGEDTGRDLYKHTASVGMYLGNVSDDEPGIAKKLTYTPRGYTSYNVTGMFAPAGEVVKVELTEADMEATGGIVVHVGQALYNNKANNIWKARGINRMPVILNTLVLDKTTCEYDSVRGVYTGYVGSFVGGPIYVCNENVKFSVTISGGVRYAHFILGYTTQEEYAENLASSTPFFDLEVRELGVLHSGPKSAAGNTSYDNIYKAAVLWEKISLVSTQRVKQGIVFLYDAFVAAGAAVAFPSQMSVNCPYGWMSGSLNYDGFVRGGAWGNIHEYNHNFQGYGCNGNDGEVTNNAISLVEYSLFTNISAARQMGSFGGGGLSGWNCYTSAPWALNKVNTGDIGGTNGLAMYATLLHNFGQRAFMSASLGGRGLSYFRKSGDVTHNNMTYFLELAKVYSLSGNGNDYSPLKTEQKDYPMFVPVSSVYQTGRSYMYDGEKKYITTMRPYTIKHGEAFDVDMRPYNSNNGMYESGSVVIPKGFSYQVKKVIAPKYGTLVKKTNDTFTYTPDPDHMESGKMIVTIEIIKDDGAFKVDDVDLVLEFKQSYEMNKTMLERTIYSFDEQNVPESATAAFESNYSGYTVKETVDNVNPVQNGNTEIWSKELLPDNTFYEIKGKIHVNETAKYRIALRGRWDCALYTSINEDGDYTLAATVKTDATHANFYTDESTYHDFAQLQAGDWVYFKAVLKSTHKGGTNAFIGVGWGQFVPPQGTLDEDGNLVDGNGNIIENPQETISISYANAYRASYEVKAEDFTSEYFYVRDYKYNYTNTTQLDVKPTVGETNYSPWTENVAEGWYDLSHLFDGRSDTWVHTAKSFYLSESNPFYINVDMGKTVNANRFNLFGWSEKNMANIGLPKTFSLELKDENNVVVYTKEFTGVTYKNKNASLDLGSDVTFRYYKLTVTQSDNGRFAMTSMTFDHVFSIPGGKVFEADNEMFRYDGDWKIESGLYTYGHLYNGKNNATLKFGFAGSYLALFAYKGTNYGGFDVYIDGKKAASVALGGDKSDAELVFLSEQLSEGEHSVEIRCNNGTANIDHVVLWK